MNRKLSYFLLIMLILVLLTSCIFPKRSKNSIPSDYPDIVWISTNDVLELYNGDNGMYGYLKNNEEHIEITISWNNTCEYYTIYTYDEERKIMLKGQISEIEEKKFRLTVEDDNLFNFEYKEFVLIEKNKL
ncbi:MAG: hypothetical protein ACI35W_03445 [Anaeroplasmataceae bacterium]